MYVKYWYYTINQLMLLLLYNPYLLLKSFSLIKLSIDSLNDGYLQAIPELEPEHPGQHAEEDAGGREGGQGEGGGGRRLGKGWWR